MTIHTSRAVQRVMHEGRAVVALESTLICHGIPRPRNAALAVAIEDAVRGAGAEPATIAVVDGGVRSASTGLSSSTSWQRPRW
jgi:pseudouridine-5'-phosphate glycosidase